MRTVHDRRKAHYFRAVLAIPGDQRSKPFDHILIKSGSGIDTIGAHLVKQLVGQVVERIGGLRGAIHLVGSDGYVHVRPSLVL